MSTATGADAVLNRYKTARSHYKAVFCSANPAISGIKRRVTVMGLWVIAGIYLAGFIISASWKSWRSLGFATLVFLPCCVVLMMLVIGSFGGAWAALIFGIPISLLILGYLVGAVARSILLIAAPRPRLFSAAVLGLSFLSIPLIVGLWFAYGEFEKREAYAALATSEILTGSSCSAARPTNSSLLDVILYRRNPTPLEPGKDDALLRYPLDYQAMFKPRLPKPMQRVEQLFLALHIDDGSPTTKDEEKDENGRFIPVDRRKPFVEFNVSLGQPVSHTSQIRLKMHLEKRIDSALPVDVQLKPSGRVGLFTVTNPKPSSKLEILLAKDNGETTAHLECRLGCEFWFDRRGLAVQGRFVPANLPKWPLIKRRIEDFVDCIHVGGLPAS